MSDRGMLGLLPRTRRGLVVRRLITALAASAIILMLAVVPVAAHNQTVSLVCEGGASVNLTDYDTAHDNSVVITLDGVEVVNKSDFGTSFVFQSGALDPFKGHTLHVVVAAWDDPTGSNGWSFDVTKQIGPCKEPTPTYGSLKITKDVAGGPEDFTGDFKVSVDCGQAGTFTKTISFPSPGQVTITGIAAGAVCTATETGMPDPPAGYTFGEPTLTGNPATIVSDELATIHVTNHLNRIPPPEPGSLKITKAIPDVPEGYEGSFGVRVTCDQGDPVNAVIEFPDPGFVTIDDIPAGASCAVIETTKSAPPAGFQFGGANINGPVTIVAGQTASITVTNPLSEVQGTPVLGVQKSNDAPSAAAGGVQEGDSVTYTLDYTVANGPVHNGIITDVLPAGVTYMTGSASSDAQFTFIDFNVTTPGALTWKAATVSANGSLTYKVTIDAGAAELAQPLNNTACIAPTTRRRSATTRTCSWTRRSRPRPRSRPLPGATSPAVRRPRPRVAACC